MTIPPDLGGSLCEMSMDKTTLDDLRREIDEIDDAIHDLLMRRTRAAGTIGGLKGNRDGPLLRPGREAMVLRRLVRRHQGPFPKPELVRIWREIMVSLVRLQGPFTVAVFAPDGSPAYLDLARDHYGSHTPTSACASASRVVCEVGEGKATVGILPYPEEEEAAPWWPLLLEAGKSGPCIIARLPFAAGGGGERSEALAIANLAPEETGEDRSLLAFETEDEISRTRLHTALSEAGLRPLFLAICQSTRKDEAWFHLVEVDGFVAPEDVRIGEFAGDLGERLSAIVTLGAYAAPLNARELDGGKAT